MLPKQIKITTEDIKYAERILLPKGMSFDVERCDFIKNLETIDLQAVPGSGKTTVLLAKLLILERYMPFDDGSGVLVISHTNIAVDEIKKKIGKYCPRLFSYPNFIGTIQSFVDHFLAIPFYTNKIRKKPYRIDSEIYNKNAEKSFDFLNERTKGYIARKSGIINNDTLDQQEEKKRKLFTSLRFDNEFNLVKGINGGIFLRSEGGSDSYNDIKRQKIKLLKDFGYLHFDDAYFLAGRYIQKYPQIINLLQIRFSFVFVDEMQDMDKHQYDILEKIFFASRTSKSNYQRIGDKNQAIFNGKVKLDDIWDISGREKLKLNGSYRLTEEVAKVVKYFGLEYLEINGLRESSNLKPCLIVFERPVDVLYKFVEIINERNLYDKDHSFCAIGWVKKHKDEGKLGIKDYYNEFEEKYNQLKIDYSCLREYLLYYEKKDSLKFIRKNILNAFIKILRIENELDENGKNYTITKFINYVKEKDFDKYEDLKLKLFEWSFSTKKGEDVYSTLKDYIKPFLKTIFPNIIFSQQTNSFINSTNSLNLENYNFERSYKESNFFENDGVKVKVGTVHSVKGETHKATLYMESFYRRGRGNYESERLIDQLKENKKVEDTIDEINTSKDLVKQSTKMVYVGFSRPTHLLCFAVHKDRFDDSFNNEDWEIIQI